MKLNRFFQYQIQKLWSYLVGHKRTDTVNRYYNSVFLATFILAFIGCIFNFIELDNWFLNISNSLFCAVILLLYYLSKFKNIYNIWTGVISIHLFLSVYWINSSGSTGSATFLFILSIVVFMNIAKRKEQLIIFYLIFFNIIILFLIEYFRKDFILPYKDIETQRIDMMFTFLTVFVSIFYMVRFFKISFDNEKETVNKQKKIIEDKNKELISSLSYASDLQKKIISNGSKLNTLFEDHFVLFKPKDIVSGDYFWVKEKGKYGIVVAADCTGHGVPAAFLSILGISLFEEIIAHEIGELNAGIILEKVRRKFIPFLRKDNSINEQALDGMDLGLCIVDYENYTFQFSGANRPLLMIRNNTLPGVINYSEKEEKNMHTLYTFKATKNTIGFNYKEDQFICHSIEFFPSDTFYIFSDGFADQFDANNKKKFNMKQLKAELLKLQNFPMASQGIFLNSMFNRWKGETSQTDDVLLIGLRM